MPNPWNELTTLGQSVWYDNLNRKLLVSGGLKRMVDEDRVTGGTSNPSIFEKAVGGSDAYDKDIRQLLGSGKDTDGIYDELTMTDVRESADEFRAAYDSTAARDGYASLEVPPNLAYDGEATIREARRLFKALDRPNVMIKIPGTQEGLSAIEHCLEEGININITLLFGIENYEQVANAYIRALEKRVDAGKAIDKIGSVASFFVSRVDALVDEKIEEMIEAGSNGRKMKLASLRGQAAIANAKVAYDRYRRIFAGPRWQALADEGAQTQRCLWASTSTKNPNYRDVIYVEELIGPDTINTVPQATLDAFREHGEVALTLTEDVAGARHTLMALEEMGIDFTAVTDELQEQGVKLFCDSYDKARATIRQKSEALAGARA